MEKKKEPVVTKLVINLYWSDGDYERNDFYTAREVQKLAKQNPIIDFLVNGGLDRDEL